MLDLVFMPKAWADLGWWVKNDLKGIKKIHALLENCCDKPFEGLDSPNRLNRITVAIGVGV